MKKDRTPRILVSLWLRIVQAILARYVRVSDDWLQQIRDAATRGPLVFVLRNRTLIDLLCLRAICGRYGLPPLGYVAGISPAAFMPLWKTVLSLFSGKSERAQADRLADTLRNGGCGVVFMRRPALRNAMGSRPTRVNGIHILVEAHKVLNASVIVVPTVFLWGEVPMKRTGGNLSFLFGTTEYPRLLRSIWLLIRRQSAHELLSGDIIDVARVRAERGDDSERLQGIVRAHVVRRIETIRRLRLGSFKKPSSRVKDEVARSGRLREELQSIAAEQGIPEKEIPVRTRGIIEKLATNFSPNILALFAMIMTVLWRRLYQGFEISVEDMNRVRDAVGKGPLLLLPCHRSHIDYLAISETMNASNIMLPHIAAGDNLAFWPMEFFFRSCGAFFIRRKFVDDKFYRAVVNAYIRRLIHENYTIEVFIEGGRSRTGKMLRPKTGMLEMALNAMATSPGKDPGVLPMFIGYDRVIEEESYIREALGRSKTSESVFGLLKSMKVLLRKYGKLYVRSGSFFTVREILSSAGVTADQLSDGGVRRDVAQLIALRTLKNINANSVVNISSVLAAVLLSHPRARMKKSVLRERAGFLARLLKASGIHLADRVQALLSDGAEASLDGALRQFMKDRRIQIVMKADDPVYEIRHGARLGLDYYKNNLLHCFVPAAFVGATLLSSTSADRQQIENDLEQMCALFRWEFLLPDVKAEGRGELQALLDKALSFLQDTGLVQQNNDSMWAVGDRENLSFVTGLLRTYCETYHCALLVTRERVLVDGSLNTNTAYRRLFESRLKSGTYRMHEGLNRITVQSAFSALKDLKLNRPPADEHPFSDGGLGDNLIRFLESAIDNSPK